MGSEDLLEAVDSLGTGTWSGTAYRHTAPGRNPLEGFGGWLYGGRWIPAEVVSTVYLAFPVEACVAEFLRMAEGQARGVASFLPRQLHEIECDSLSVVDLTIPGALPLVGLHMDDLASRDYRKCQDVGAASYFLGHQGVLAPSATGLGSVLAVFEPRLAPDQLRLRGTQPFSDFLD